jgi:hypothetical protein
MKWTIPTGWFVYTDQWVWCKRNVQPPRALGEGRLVVASERRVRIGLGDHQT